MDVCVCECPNNIMIFDFFPIIQRFKRTYYGALPHVRRLADDVNFFAGRIFLDRLIVK